MISVDIEFLTGRYIATAYNDRRKAEWPPEPARFFSACVATLHEFSELGENSRRALQWLEALGPPHIVASPGERRTISDVYVPVNDATVCSGWEKNFEAYLNVKEEHSNSSDENTRKRTQKKLDRATTKFETSVRKKLQQSGTNSDSAIEIAKSMIPDDRVRQPRTFPSVTPWNPKISFVWKEASIEQTQRQGLEAVLERMVRLGHSSSLVRARLGDGRALTERPEETWIPDADGGELTMRIIEAGQLQRLEAAFEHHQGCEPRVAPCSFQLYRQAKSSQELPPSSVFDTDWVIFRAIAAPGMRRATRFSLTRGVELARALRGALMNCADELALQAISGHAPNGQPLAANHVAFLPLADVAGQWASGAILGMAVVLPEKIDKATRRAVYRSIGAFEEQSASAAKPCHLHMGRLGELFIERVRSQERRTTLQEATWCKSARHWASVTPVALDKHPGDISSDRANVARAAEERASESIARSCERIGLPRPISVQIMRRSLFDAAPESRRFMPFPRNRNPKRLCVHATIEFDKPVQGPIILGSGRYFGLGLFRNLTGRRR